ncbi:MAG TPA: AMP-binding protein [Streptosporangiaceae bacterium]|nr:AMP-binding protein [Streptosporangiaceae bacterium]
MSEPTGPAPERLDDLLTAAASRSPGAAAIASPAGALTFAELDSQVTRVAAGLRGWLGDDAAVVGIANTLDVSFAVALYAVVRAGYTALVLNPLHPGQMLAQAAGAAGAAAVIAPSQVLAALADAPGRPTGLRELILADGLAGGEPTLASIATADVTAWVPPSRGPRDIALIQFTSGTTGRPKGVRLTHRNLVVNAAQVARAHELGPSSVTLNHLPTLHPMHLNAAICAGATQVLCPDPSSARAVEMANTCRATHYYSLPVRLAQLAAAPDLAVLRFETVQAVLSGGSALPGWAATALRAHFGVPVVQGYGLAEMSPLTHSDPPSRPAPGSVGPVVADTQCRVVGLTSRETLPAQARGEVQVRGPQLMAGYLDPAEPSGVDAGGWLSTGDVGYLDDEGRLFLVDRIKDVFKCDNWMIAPSEVEAVLIGHPGVADCVVVELPDDFHGAVAGAAVVLRDGCTPGEVARWLRDRVPYYQCLHAVAVVGEVTRSPNGKVQRRQFRDLVAAAPRLTPAEPDAHDEEEARGNHDQPAHRDR